MTESVPLRLVARTCGFCATLLTITVAGDGFHNRAQLAAHVEQARRHLQQVRALLSPATAAARNERPAPEPPGPLAYREAAARLEQRVAEAERKPADLATRLYPVSSDCR